MELSSGSADSLPDHVFAALDDQMRITIPQLACEWADPGPDSPVVVVGAGQMAEVWNQPAWEHYRANTLNLVDGC